VVALRECIISGRPWRKVDIWFQTERLKSRARRSSKPQLKSRCCDSREFSAKREFSETRQVKELVSLDLRGLWSPRHILVRKIRGNHPIVFYHGNSIVLGMKEAVSISPSGISSVERIFPAPWYMKNRAPISAGSEVLVIFLIHEGRRNE
jgi:hypothetical protein